MRRCRASFLLALAFALTASAAPPIPTPDGAAWEAVDVVPMPKRLRLAGDTLDLSRGVVLVLGAKPCRQSRIGAEWINKRVQAHGGVPLRIVSIKAVPADAAALVIGTWRDNALIADAVKRGLVDVGKDNPGGRGYEIRLSPEERRVYLAGADPLGALYACVTLGEMLAKQPGAVHWRRAEVRDWPDYRHAYLGPILGTSNAIEFPGKGIICAKPRPSQREAYLRGVRAYYDRLLRWKVSSFLYGLYWHFGIAQRSTPEGRAVLREGVEYGKERGIAALISCKPFVGLKTEFPGLKPELKGGRPAYKAWVRGWAPRYDAPRREHAARVAKFGREVGATEFYFHDTDTGGLYNPTRWNDRDAESRKRWGDDYAAAVAHKHLIHYRAIKREVPDARILYTFYPYCPKMLAPDEPYSPELKQHYRDFWRRLGEFMPDDVIICMRETYKPQVDEMRKLWKQPVHLWYGGDKLWQTFFTEYVRHMITFYGDPNDHLWPVPRGEVFVPLQGLAALEYAWNVHAPGATHFYEIPKKYGAAYWKQSEGDGPTFTVILPHVVRNLFGRRAAPAVYKAVRANLSFNQVFHPLARTRRQLLTTHELMKKQADAAETGVRALDRLWNQARRGPDRMGMDDYAFRRLVYMREVFHTCQWMAKLQAAELLARKLARKQDPKGAREAIEAGLKLVPEARRDLAALLKERPKDPVFAVPRSGRMPFRERLLHAYMADGIIDLGKMEKRLKQTQGALGEMGPVPANVLKVLAGGRMLRAVAAKAPVRVDGKLDEPAWRSAYPIEGFLVYQHGKRIATAHTRVRLAYDATRLYVAFESWVPGGEKVRDDDGVEVFLKPRSMGGDYVHFLINAAGRVRHQYQHYQGSRTRGWKPDNAWVCPGVVTKIVRVDGRWDLEMSFPLKALKIKRPGEAMTGNFARACPRAAGGPEFSSTQPPDAVDFHDSRRFPKVIWAGDDVYRMDRQVETPGFKVAAKTLDDGIASMASFHIELRVSQVLNDLRVTAEAYGPKGRLRSRSEIARAPRVFYQWRSPAVAQVPFGETVKAGAVRLRFVCHEGEWDHWVRFGGSTQGLFRREKDAPPGFRATAHVVGPVWFPTMVKLGGAAKSARLFETKQGTVEFWLQPSWSGRFPPPSYFKSEYRWMDHCLLNFGRDNARAPRHYWPSALILQHHGYYGQITAAVVNKQNVSWSAWRSVKQDAGWRRDVWRHVAVVWDASAKPGDWVRFYVDGKRASGPAKCGKANRLGEDKSVRLQVAPPFPFQLGAINTGRNPCRGAFDELRCSRTARYTKDFTPSKTPLELDRDTTALFHFDNALEGEGVAPNGARYTLQATPGAVGYH